MSPPELPRVDAIEVDGAALAFALGLTTLIGLVVGAVPALHWLGRRPERRDSADSTRITGGHHSSRGVARRRSSRAGAVLLVHAGLLLRSLQSLFAVPPGFDPAHLLTMQVQTAGQRFRDPNATHQFFTQALEAVRRCRAYLPQHSRVNCR